VRARRRRAHVESIACKVPWDPPQELIPSGINKGSGSSLLANNRSLLLGFASGELSEPLARTTLGRSRKSLAAIVYTLGQSLLVQGEGAPYRKNSTRGSQYVYTIIKDPCGVDDPPSPTTLGTTHEHHGVLL